MVARGMVDLGYCQKTRGVYTLPNISFIQESGVVNVPSPSPLFLKNVEG